MHRFKRILIALFSGFLILVVTWLYQNYDYTLGLEEAYFKKVFLVRDKILSPAPRHKADFMFINTGKDLALVEDTVEYGVVAVSDREKIYQLIKHINAAQMKPEMCVIDIQFYYPFTAQPAADSALASELKKMPDVVIPILKGSGGKYKKPLYVSNYGHSDYRTFSSSFNKFRVILHEEVKSIPIVMHEHINQATYEDNWLYTTCNGSLSLSSLWPVYYLKDDSIKKTSSGTSISEIEKVNGSGVSMVEFYNLGEILFDIEANPALYNNAFENKIVIVGNFQEDVHATPVGKMSGPVLLANIYLSLLNGEHIVSPWLLLLLLAAFAALSYIAIFEKMPEINLTFRFLFSSYLTKFIKRYISYFGSMFLISLLALIVFNVQVALFLPSLIFTGIEYVKEKKYLELKK